MVTTPPGERHGLPALMAAVCLREDHWLVHHLADDLPVAEVTWLAGQVGAGLVVLSSATTSAARRARGAAGEITAALPGVTVLTGRPGDSLHDLRARAAGLPRARPRPGPVNQRAERVPARTTPRAYRRAQRERESGDGQVPRRRGIAAAGP